MNKKLLTKFVVVLAIVVSIFLGTYNVLTPNYDSNILNDAKTFTTSTDLSDLTTNPFLNTSRYFDVVEMEKKDHISFKVDVNGTIMNINAEDSADEKVVPTETFELSDTEYKIIESSQKLVFKYINSSKILRNQKGSNTWECCRK